MAKPSRLRFLFGGVLLHTVDFDALLLDEPFSHASADPAAPPPPPETLPAGVEGARILACPLEPRLRPIALLPGLIRYIGAQYSHFHINLSGSFEGYLLKFSSKSRNTLKRKLRKYQKGSGLEQPCREYRRCEEMAEFHRLACAVSRKTYQHRLLDAGIPESDEFRDELLALAGRGRVRGYILFHGKEPASYGLCYAYGDTLTFDRTGFDPAFAWCHPGTVLTYLIIQRLFGEHRFRIFDFGSGDFDYKRFFATGSERCADICYFRRTARNLALVSLHCGLNLVSHALKKALDVLGLKARVKRIVHRRF